MCLLAGILILNQSGFCRSDPVRSDPIRSDPIRSDPVRSDPVRSDPIRSDPGFANGLFLPLLNPPSNNVELQKIIAKHIHDCYEIIQKTSLTVKIRKLSNCKFIWRVVDVQCIRHQIKYVCMYVCT